MQDSLLGGLPAALPWALLSSHRRLPLFQVWFGIEFGQSRIEKVFIFRYTPQDLKGFCAGVEELFFN